MSVASRVEDGSERMESEVKLKPNQRLSGLEQFYGSSTSMAEVVVEDDLKTKKASDEVMGQWVLDQFVSFAKTLGVIEFIIPIDQGGREIPDIAPIEEYVEMFRVPRAGSIAKIDGTLVKREAFLAILDRKLEEAAAMVTGRSGTTTRSQEADEEQYAKVYNEWNQCSTQIQSDKDKMEQLMMDDFKSGNKQYQADFDAIKNAKTSVSNLKKCVSKLLKKEKFHFIEIIARAAGPLGEDPYENNDMRGVYANLVERFRKGDSMGILTTILEAMKSSQGSSSVSSLLREVESFHISMVRLKVESISISDLSALIVVNGMNPKTRSDFLTQESVLELTLSSMDEEPEEGENDSVRSQRKDKKSLFNRVRAYAKNNAQLQIVAGKFKESGENDKESKAAASAAAAVTAVANRQVLSVTEATATAQFPCKFFAKDGNCPFGARCKFLHNTKRRDEGVGVCFQFRNTGKCTRDGCKFSHGDPPSASQAKVGEDKTVVGKPAPSAIAKKVFFENVEEEDASSNMVRVQEDDATISTISPGLAVVSFS